MAPERKQDGNVWNTGGPLWEQCVEFSSKIVKDLLDLFDVGFEWNHGSVDDGRQCSLIWSFIEERGWSCFEMGIRFWGWRSNEERKAVEDMDEAGWRRKYEGWFEKGRCTLPINVAPTIHFAEQSGVLALIGLLLGWGESGHPHLLEILLDFNIGLSL